jgi:alkylation response protein AidB-like acyl-CoA dehydrogenase
LSVRFAFTDDQIALRDAVRDLLAKECPPEVVRAAWPDGANAHGTRTGEGARADAEQVFKVWAGLADMGVLGVAVSEAGGGLGLDEVDWVLLAEESGYSALPHPFVETACVGAPLLDECGADPDLLAAAVAGSARIAIATLGSALVPWGDTADALFLVDANRRVPVLGEHQEWEANRVQGGSAFDPDATIGPVADAVDGGRPIVPLEGMPASNGLAEGAVAQWAFDRGALGTAAQLVGLGRRMLDLTVGYVSERRQFGVPVGSQQAVKHQLADAAMGLRFAAPAVYGAAWSLATGDPHAARAVSTAKALASDAARATARAALQCHGAIGYTVEYDLHLYLKRAEALARAWGDAAWHRRRVAAALGI